MKSKSFIGIDVSKLSLDICLITEEGEIKNFKANNTVGHLKKLFKLIAQDVDVEETLVCAEYTGHYSNILKSYCLDNGVALWLESGAEIKLRSGVQRCKSDKIDAQRIAEYAMRHSDKALLQTLEDEVISESKLLLSERKLYVGERAKYRTQLKDLGGFVEKSIFKERSKRLKRHVALLTKSIEEIDRTIKELFSTEILLAHQSKILTSIPGVGDQVAIHTIVATNGFTKFKNGRKFACHVGVAPFSFHSGTSQRSRNKVSHRANKELKTLFHMAALSAIKMKGEFHDYFKRKVAEGKNKMTVINAVRAKIINRIFTLIKENRKYEKNYNLPLVNP
ncbi:IS110 family transposase [Arenibacter sp. TNZ]|jgi:transposase|uniref:IS110 family transposase n=1 Tax=Arenibacter TaxID=178469 RepID=UPI000CD3D0CD|nr:MULTISPECIES: IS110 family transposase [Arenibacter]MCM4174325.1 IS110 family transposase [Arenibacter sp. TNZ]